MTPRTGLLLGILAVALLAVGVFIHRGFPTMDDGEVLTELREFGAASIPGFYPDRPVSGWILRACVGLFGERILLWELFSLAAWGVLAWQVSRLVRLVLSATVPESLVAALLVISPIVVQYQFTTISALATYLPVIFALEGILAAFRADASRARLPAAATAAAWVAAGALISEYAVITALAAVALFCGLGMWRRTFGLLAGSVVGYGAYRWLSVADARPRTVPSTQMALALEHAMVLPLRWLNGLWFSVVGAYCAATGSARIDVESRSTIAASIFGVACALAVGYATRDPRAENDPRRIAGDADGIRFGRREAIGLALAILAGLLPIVAADRETVLSDFGSRFRAPILPFAIAATLGLLMRLTVPRWRFLALALLAYVAGFTIVGEGMRVTRHQGFYDEVAAALRPTLSDPDGITVVVVADDAYAVPYAKLARRWTTEEERRVWVLQARYAPPEFGERDQCRDVGSLEIPATLRTVGRSGSITRLLWAERLPRTLLLEPYCRGGGQIAADDRLKPR